MSRLFEYRVPDRYYEQRLNNLLLGDGRATDTRHQNLFRSVSDEFCLWLHTEGVRVNPRIDTGEFCFDTSVESYGDVSSYLGETCIPEQYVLKYWRNHLHVLDFVHDRAVCPQDVIVATQRAGAPTHRGAGSQRERNMVYGC